MKYILTASCIIFLIVGKAKSQCNINPAFTTNVAYYDSSVIFFYVDSSTASLQHLWYFGENSIGFNGWGGGYISHGYSTPGTYSVLHLIIDSVNSCRDSIWQNVIVAFTPVCNVSISGSRSFAINNGYTFQANANVTGYYLKGFTWTIDGESRQAYYDFLQDSSMQPGLHTVCVSAESVLGCVATACTTINVIPLPKCNFNTVITATESRMHKNTFDFEPSPAGNSRLCYWNFGDGDNIFSYYPTHLYSSAGNYTVTLAMYDSLAGCVDTIQKVITVTGKEPEDSCSLGFNYTIDNRLLSLNAVSNKPMVNTNWYITSWTMQNMTDSIYGINLHGNPVQYALTDTGVYFVYVNATTANGCMVQYWDTIVIDHFTSGRPAASLITAYPNPAVNEVSMKLDLSDAAAIQYKVYNSFGVPVRQAKLQGIKGNNIIKMAVENLPKGTYYVDIISGNTRKRSIFQKF